MRIEKITQWMCVLCPQIYLVIVFCSISRLKLELCIRYYFTSSKIQWNTLERAAIWVNLGSTSCLSNLGVLKISIEHSLLSNSSHADCFICDGMSIYIKERHWQLGILWSLHRIDGIRSGIWRVFEINKFGVNSRVTSTAINNIIVFIDIINAEWKSMTR